MAEIWKSQGIACYLAWTEAIILELDLNEWETQFIKGMYKLLKRGFDLSESQAKKLEQIYVRTS